MTLKPTKRFIQRIINSIEIMVKYTLLLPFLLSLGGCSSEKDGRPRQIVLEYKNGNVAIEGTLNGENEKVGEWKTYFPSGDLFERINYDASHEDYYKLYQTYNENGRLIRETQENATQDKNHFNFVEKYYTNEGLLRYDISTDIYKEYDDGGAYYDYFELEKKIYQNGSVMKAAKFIDHELIYTDWYDINGEFQGRVYSTNSKYKVEHDN